MKLCLILINSYVGKGKRLMKTQQLMEELEKSMDDKIEKQRLMEGLLGYIICSTQVNFKYFRKKKCSKLFHDIFLKKGVTVMLMILRCYYFVFTWLFLLNYKIYQNHFA